MAERYKIGRISVPLVGSENGIYIEDLQATRSVTKGQMGLFVSDRVLRASGQEPTEFRDGQLVQYKVNDESPLLVAEIRQIPVND